METSRICAMCIECYILSVNLEYPPNEATPKQILNFALATVFKEYFNGHPRLDEVKIHMNPKYFSKLYAERIIEKYVLERSHEEVFMFEGIIIEPNNEVMGAIIANNDPNYRIIDPEYISATRFPKSEPRYSVGDKVHITISERLEGTGSIDNVYWVNDPFTLKNKQRMSPDDFTWGYHISWDAGFKYPNSKVFIPERMVNLI
jgi:hypothetical protein